MNSGGLPDEFWWLLLRILVATQVNSDGYPDVFWWLPR